MEITVSRAVRIEIERLWPKIWEEAGFGDKLRRRKNLKSHKTDKRTDHRGMRNIRLVE